MLTQYKNLDEILNAKGSISGDRIESKARALLSYPLNKRIDFNPTLEPSSENKFELHVISSN